jgi:COP9 signalosome complex subunit 1
VQCLMTTIQPNWDLDQYILNYKGHGQIHRLRFIALKSTTYAVDALKLAVRLIKETTLNVVLYQDTVKQLQLHSPTLPEAVLDQAWMDHAIRSSKLTVEKLEAELKNYKNNLIKESIRVIGSARTRLIVDGPYGPRRTLLQMRRL